MAKLSVVLTLAVVLAFGSQVAWRDTIELNAARLAHTRALLGSDDDQERLAQQAHMLAGPMAALVRHSRAQALVGSLRSAEGDIGSAAGLLSRAVALDKYDASSRELLADALFRAGDVDAAVTHWRAARAGAMVQRRARSAMNAGDSLVALSYLRALTRVDDDAPDGWLELAAAHEALGDLAAARVSYEAVIARFPRRAVGYARLANMYFFRMNQPELASEVLDAAIANAPGAEFYMVRSQVASRQRRYTDAEADARQALVQEPTNLTYLLWLGDLLHSQKRYDDAIAQYDVATERASKPSVVWLAPLRKGRTLTAANRLDDAVAAYETALVASVAQRVPAATLAEHYVLLGEACVRVDRIARAQWAFAQALKHDPANESAGRHLKAPAVK